MKQGSRPTKQRVENSEGDSHFAAVVAAFKNRPVTQGGKGFGSTGLKVNGKLFTFMSSKGEFVAKLPRARVDDLVNTGKGKHFDPGHGRLMKEWIAVDAGAADWVSLAGEAYQFVRRETA